MRQVAARLTSPESPNLNLDPIERMTMLNRHIMQFMHRSYPKIADSITALEKAIRETPVVIGIGYHLNPFVEDIPYRAHAIRLMWNDAGVDICLMEPKLFSTRSSVGLDEDQKEEDRCVRGMLQHTINVATCLNDMQFIPEEMTTFFIVKYVVPYVHSILDLARQIDWTLNMTRSAEDYAKHGFVPQLEHLTGDALLLAHLKALEEDPQAQIESGSR